MLFLLNHDATVPDFAAERLRLLSIVLPAEVLAGFAAPAPGEIRPVSPSTSLLDPAVAFAERAAVVDADPVSAFGNYYLRASPAGDGAGRGCRGHPCRGGRPSARSSSRCLNLITAQASDPLLSPRGVAEQLRLSCVSCNVRSGHRVRRWNGRSADRASSMRSVCSRIPRTTALSIEEIGRYSGLSGGSSLARAMAHEGRRAPLEVRRRREG